MGLDGSESIDILGLDDGLTPKQKLKVVAHKKDGSKVEFGVTSRIDAEIEIEYFKHGGILQYLVATVINN